MQWGKRKIPGGACGACVNRAAEALGIRVADAAMYRPEAAHETNQHLCVTSLVQYGEPTFPK